MLTHSVDASIRQLYSNTTNTHVWQTTSVPSSLTYCGLYKPRLPPTCLRHSLMFRSCGVRHVPASPSFLHEFTCVTPKRGLTSDSTCTQQNFAAGHHTVKAWKLCKDEISTIIFTSGQCFQSQCALDWWHHCWRADNYIDGLQSDFSVTGACLQ